MTAERFSWRNPTLTCADVLTGARLIMGEVAPGVLVIAVILAHRAPLALTQVGSPLAPGDFLLASFV